jgi:hypothetical protein
VTIPSFNEAKSQAEGRRQTAHQEAIDTCHEQMREEKKSAREEKRATDYRASRVQLDATIKAADRAFYKALRDLGTEHGVSTDYNPGR